MPILKNNINKTDLTQIDCEVVDWMNVIIFVASIVWHVE